MFQRLADVYSFPYSTQNAQQPGIVLRLTAAVETPSVRSTVQQTYDQIINDLKEAAELLPLNVTYPTRPCKTAAYAALARTYLAMRDYVNAEKYADLALQQNNQLLDYNTVSLGTIDKFNKEVIYYSHGNFTSRNPYFFLGGKVDSTLYSSYDINDARKTVFFSNNGDGTFAFWGSYDSQTFPSVVFDGLATDEMFLIRAECLARAGNKDAALADLNTLMVKRWVNNGSWVPFSAPTAADALDIILKERRKELLYRGLRWADIRRLNLEGANITLRRIINGTTYTLPPNDLRYVALIPLEVLRLTSIQQTPR
jgi:starch-binding outer membrane protein, SusD/RagB family